MIGPLGLIKIKCVFLACKPTVKNEINTSQNTVKTIIVIRFDK